VQVDKISIYREKPVGPIQGEDKWLNDSVHSQQCAMVAGELLEGISARALLTKGTQRLQLPSRPTVQLVLKFNEIIYNN